ncbi:MAG: efflux RND transporter periplasmic adaptor subunit [Alphaproteobacteria bacterium]|nr:efflux RND transporter periplasmic adaptor subunit [Alphaproteobacteria bacterium]
MSQSSNLTPVLAGIVGLLVIAGLGGGYYYYSEYGREKPVEAVTEARVPVTKATNACFSDQVRGIGLFVARREAVVVANQEGARVASVLVREGDMVVADQELVRLNAAPHMPGQPPGPPGPNVLKAPAAGLVTEVRTAVGAPTSPQAGPMFRIAINNELELEAMVPAVHMYKINPGVTVRISGEAVPDITGKVRRVAPEIDRATQIGRVRISFTSKAAVKAGMFARVSIDARRSCGVAAPRSAIDRQTLQVVRDNVVETRKVRVGLISEDSAEILEGLEVGEIVVTDAGSSLRDGDRINTIFADDDSRVH